MDIILLQIHFKQTIQSMLIMHHYNLYMKHQLQLNHHTKYTNSNTNWSTSIQKKKKKKKQSTSKSNKCTTTTSNTRFTIPNWTMTISKHSGWSLTKYTTNINNMTFTIYNCTKQWLTQSSHMFNTWTKQLRVQCNTHTQYKLHY